ncbi:MAG: FkbM family methyltransferase [Pseudomonadota bacterium]
MIFQRVLKPSIERTPVAAVYRAARDELRWACRKFVETPLGFRLAGSPRMQAGTFEPDEVALITAELTKADVFVDVGANVGFFTCLARSMEKYTIAVEPLPDNLRYLYGNLVVNGWTDCVEVFPLGIADAPGLAELYGAGTGASLLRGWAGISEHFKRIVPVSTLDTIVGHRFDGKRIVIKMDVEGAEFRALLGASETLGRRPQPTWIIEITYSANRPNGTSNPNFADTFHLMWEHGYRVHSIGSACREITCQEIEEFEMTGREPKWGTLNYLFVGA